MVKCLWIVLCIQICCSFSQIWKFQNGNLGISVNETNGEFVISINNKNWFSSGPVALHREGQWYFSKKPDAFSGHWTPLSLKATKVGNGVDPHFGDYQLLSFEWAAVTTPFHTIFKFFTQADQPLILFEQHFNKGVEKASLDNNMEVVSSFPTLQIADADLYFATFQGLWDLGTVGQASGKTLQGYRGGVDGGMPLAIYESSGNPTVVLSPFENFPIGYQCQPQYLNSLAFGISGKVHSIPKQFRHSTILSLGNRITESIVQWGSKLLTHYEKTPKLDVPIQYLGYWTDNGGYYYYMTEPNKNYEQTMLDTYAEIKRLNIPVQYIQFDSWWYYQGNNNGVTLWDSRPDVFPSGISNVQSKIGLPLELHNRYWATDNLYQKNFTFVVENYESLPLQQEFWDYLMEQAASYGCIVYEQDWLIDQFERMNATQTSVHTARDWLMQMGNAAEKHGLTIQYCMPLWNDYLQTVEIKAVTQIRASNDYNPGRRQWPIGKSSIIAWALGLRPFKDVFWSTSVQPGNKYNMNEPNPELQAIISTLSTGLVGFGDGIGYMNRTLIMQTCNDNGLILKPDKPATAIERSFLPSPPQGELYWTYSNISGYSWYYVLAADMKASYQVVPDDLYMSGESARENRVFNWRNPQQISIFSDSYPIQIQGYPNNKNWPMDYYVVIPALPNDFVVLGEITKFVTMSSNRFSGIQVDSSSIDIQFTGAAHENVTIAVSHIGCIDQVFTTTCNMGGKSSASLTCVYSSTVSCKCY